MYVTHVTYYGTASPLAIEAVQQLAQLGEKESDILNLVGKSVGNQRWLLSLVAARVQQAVCDHKVCNARNVCDACNGLTQ